MKFPKINKQAMRTVSIPELSGGMNLRDSVTMIQDNQLTDCKNMWFKDGILKTRPGLIANSDFSTALPVNSTIGNTDYDKIKAKVTNIVKTESGIDYRLCTYSVSDGTKTEIHFRFTSDSAIQELPIIVEEDADPKYFTVEHKGTLYCFFNYEDVHNIYKLTPNAQNWSRITDNDIYTPLVYIHCKCDATGDSFEGTQYEGFNLIGNRFRMIYSTVNKSLLSPTNTTHFMDYVVPYCANPNAVSSLISVFKAKITYASGNVVTHTFSTKEGSEYWESAVQSDGLRMMANPIGNDRILVCFVDSEGQFKSVSASNFLEDNMEIIAPCDCSVANYERVLNMTQATWYGGASNGINGGTRLFLGGNTEEKSIVVWSELDNPLYFPENCYAYVGNSSQSVTAFGKQSDMLVIFKENEIYYTKYTQNNNISASDLINQNVVDYTASSVYFPMIQLHAGIGCDCPNTVQLCRNRLVWTCKDGNVYTLVSENQFSERNVYNLSEMVYRKLKGESGLANAYACDWDGKYLLFIKNHVYVMDYNSYGYVYAASFSKAEDANIKIPWHYWELPAEQDYNKYLAVYENDGRVLLLTLERLSGKYYANMLYMDETSTHDEALGNDLTGSKVIDNIPCYLKTKLFDFGTPAYRKNIPLVNISFGNNGGVPITVSFDTESQSVSDEETVELTESSAEAYSNEYVHNRQFRPCVRLVSRIGINISCDGYMAVDAISLNYRLLGGAR